MSSAAADFTRWSAAVSISAVAPDRCAIQVSYGRAVCFMMLMRAKADCRAFEQKASLSQYAPVTSLTRALYDPGEIGGFLLLRRYRAGGTPNRRLKARLNAASDS